MKNSIITSTGSHIPSLVVSNKAFLSNTFYNSDGLIINKPINEIINKLEEVTGIMERRYASDQYKTSDIATLAAEHALESINKEELDCIIVAHNYGDNKPDNNRADIIPSLASRVKHKLKIKNPYTIAFDITFGCPGYIHGLVLADNLIKLGQARKALVIGADILSRSSDPHDMDSMIYADGAGATLLESTEDHSGIMSHVTRTDTYDEAYLFRLGKSYNAGYNTSDLFSKMDGHEIYKYAAEYVPVVVKKSLDKVGLGLNDVSKILIHQANQKLDETILINLFKLYHLKEIPKDIMPMTISYLGNSSVATIPTLLDLIVRQKLENHMLNPGDIVVFASVGAGMNINSIVYKVPGKDIETKHKDQADIENKRIEPETDVDQDYQVSKAIYTGDSSECIPRITDYLCEQVVASLTRLGTTIDLNVKKDDCLTDFGFDSLSAIDLQTNIKHEFGLEIPLTKIFSETKIFELAEFIFGLLPSLENSESDLTNLNNDTSQIEDESWFEGEI